MSDEKTEKNVGRPSLYKPEYCQAIIKHMEKGYSFESFAAVIKVNRDTLYEWQKVHAEFSDAIKLAFDECQLFWEKKGMEGTFGELEGFSAAAYIFNMKNRFKWKDKQPEEIGNVTVNNNTVNVSDAELDAKISKLLEGKK